MHKRLKDELHSRETLEKELTQTILHLKTQLADKDRELQSKNQEVESTKLSLREVKPRELRSEEPKKESAPLETEDKVHFRIAQKMRGDDKLNSEASSQCLLFDSMIKP